MPDFERFRLVEQEAVLARTVFDPPDIGFIRYIENITWQDQAMAGTFAYIYMLLTDIVGTATPTGQPENIIYIDSHPTVIGQPLGYSVNFPQPLMWEHPYSLVFGNFNSPAAGPKTATVTVTESPTS